MILDWLKRFWWVLALVGIAGTVWIRRLQLAADRAKGLQVQKEIERNAMQEHEQTGNKSRRAKAELNRQLESSRTHWTAKKAELEAEIAQNDQKLADAWNRAFGRDAGRARTEGSGE